MKDFSMKLNSEEEVALEFFSLNKDFSLKRKYYIVGALINHIRKFRKYYE